MSLAAIDATRVTALAALITAIVAFLTAIVTLLTVAEMRRQRKSQLRPELVLDDTPFVLYRCGTYGKELVFALCSPGDPPIDSDDIHGRCGFQLINVGRGVAKDVEASWKFDQLEFAARLAPVANAVGGRVWIEGPCILFEKDDKSTRWIARTGQTHRLGTITATEGTRGKRLSLDQAYSLLLASYFVAAAARAGQDNVLISKAPSISLEMAYSDMEGKRYTKRAAIGVELEILASDGFGSAGGEWFEVGYGSFVISDA